MRKKQIYVLPIILALISFSGISLGLYAIVGTNTNLIDKPTSEITDDSDDEVPENIKEVRSRPEERLSFGSDGDLEGIDGTPRLEGLTFEGVQPDTGNPWVVPVSDDYWGGFYLQTFECVLQGEYANIWIGLNDSVWTGGFTDEHDDNGTPEVSDDTWYFAYPWSSEGANATEWDAPDPDEDGYYLPPGYRDWITGADLEYTLDEFDNNIHDTVVEHFGMYADRPGPFNDYKIQILIFNIRDGLFYDPINAPWFIIGYYWYFASNLNDANIFHMDSYQWWRRLDSPSTTYYGLNPLPYQYEGTFAHEFQHLVHRDIDFNEMSWISEGCSMLAEWLCGYGFSPGHISEYLIYWWDTSLVIWQSTLADYGAVFLWMFYMYEHYGGAPLIRDLVHEQANGIEGWSNTLINHGITRTFDQIFQDWAIANYLDDTSIAGGKYGYYALDLPSADTDWWDIPYTLWLWEYLYPGLFDTQVDTYPTNGYNYPYGFSLPYVVNYVEFFNDDVLPLNLQFDGADYSGVVPYSGSYEWYSDGTAYSWFRLGQAFSIPEGGATLKFWTYFEIESDWDYGYVEVHDLNTDEWYTLSGQETISGLPNSYSEDNPNCPDDFEPTAYFDAGRWNAFTGFSHDWYQEEMDLSMFEGHEIEIYFTYWSDPFVLELGWYIDDIEISEIGFFDDVESGEDGWTVNAGWYVTDGVVLNDFEVSILTNTDFIWNNILIDSWYLVSSLDLDEVTEEGQTELIANNMKFEQSYAVMVAANQPGYEHTFGTFYDFYVDNMP
ncbi:MAG: hypothetical protein ACXAC5_15770 [Promethearchaeota archaeon]|jgi:hypothetical protein